MAARSGAERHRRGRRPLRERVMGITRTLPGTGAADRPRTGAAVSRFLIAAIGARRPCAGRGAPADSRPRDGLDRAAAARGTRPRRPAQPKGDSMHHLVLPAGLADGLPHRRSAFSPARRPRRRATAPNAARCRRCARSSPAMPAASSACPASRRSRRPSPPAAGSNKAYCQVNILYGESGAAEHQHPRRPAAEHARRRHRRHAGRVERAHPGHRRRRLLGQPRGQRAGQRRLRRLGLRTPATAAATASPASTPTAPTTCSSSTTSSATR